METNNPGKRKEMKGKKEKWSEVIWKGSKLLVSKGNQAKGTGTLCRDAVGRTYAIIKSGMNSPVYINSKHNPPSGMRG